MDADKDLEFGPINYIDQGCNGSHITSALQIRIASSVCLFIVHAGLPGALLGTSVDLASERLCWPENCSLAGGRMCCIGLGCCAVEAHDDKLPGCSERLKYGNISVADKLLKEE
jgi:hypothetical protein